MKLNSPIIRTLIWLTLFSIAMGYLESSVVVYLRMLYYPEGFSFPLTPIDQDIVAVEFWREAATMIMLVGVALLTGKNAIQRFAFFLFSFAIWDIFYYVFLYTILGWPESLLTWDILFLIPVPWVGPVLTPLIITFLMIVLALLMAFFDHKCISARINSKEWLMLIGGSLIVIISWTRDYFNYIANNHPGSSIWSLSSQEALFAASEKYIPQSFNWALFGLGIIVILSAIGSYYYRNKKLLSASRNSLRPLVSQD